MPTRNAADREFCWTFKCAQNSLVINYTIGGQHREFTVQIQIPSEDYLQLRKWEIEWSVNSKGLIVNKKEATQ
jgi:hypothetical protein